MIMNASNQAFEVVNLSDYPPVLTQLSSQHLPVLPHGAQKLLASLNDESLDFAQLTEVLENFPTIVARLISLANSAWSAPRSEITSLPMACSRLGLNVVRSTSIALAVAAPFNQLHCPQFDPKRYWTRALCCAEMAFRLASNHPDVASPQTLRAAGLLHNLGLLWLADQLPVLTQQSFLMVQKQPHIRLDEALREITGAGYTEAGAYLANSWGLPEIFEHIMDYQNADFIFSTAAEQSPHRLDIRLVSAAVVLIKQHERNIREEQMEDAYEETETLLDNVQLAQALGIPLDQFEVTQHALAADYQRYRELANTLFA